MGVRRDRTPERLVTGSGQPSPGFTLVEIVLVLVVLALASALAVPALQPALEAVRAESAARRAASFLDEARRQAVLRRATVTVRCEAEEGTLRVAGDGGAAFRVPEGSAIVSCEPPEVRYFAQGYASGGAIVLRDAAGRERRVAVGSFTGLARLEDAP